MGGDRREPAGGPKLGKLEKKIYFVRPEPSNQMKKIVLLAGILFPYVLLAQCPTDIQLNLHIRNSSTGSCPGDTLIISSAKDVNVLDWYRDGNSLRHVMATTNQSILTVAGGNGYGSADNQIGSITGVTVDNSGNVYLVDLQWNRVQKWAPGATSGVTVAGGNGQGSAANQFNQPTGLFLDANGNLYVSDCYNYRIQKFAPGATSGVTVAGGNGPGSAANQLNVSEGIFVDPNGNIYIADDLNHRIQKWAPGASSGVTVAGGNGPGNAANQLYDPPDVFVDAGGNVYVADLMNNRVQKWAPGATSGVTVAGGNGYGQALNQVDQPVSVFVDAAGNLFVGDGDNRVMEWAPGATSGVLVAGGDAPSSSMDRFNGIASIWVDAAGDIYVGDYGNTRVQEWMIPHPIDSIYIADQPGSYTAKLTTATGCPLSYGPMVIDAVHVPTVAIGTTTPEICSGANVVFTASPTEGGNQPGYQWQVNGVSQAGGGASWSDAGLSDGDIVSCLMTSTATCPSPRIAASNQVVMAVTPAPTISLAPEIGINYGQSVQLDPVITGTIDVYAWAPATGLSATNIADPVSTPDSTTTYTLTATTANHCTASGKVTVKLLTALRIPSAFSPNGDGRNDIFYVLGGAAGSVVKQLSVFNRWGQCVFQVHDAPPGDPAWGWDGHINGSAAPTGVYAYVVEIQMGDGTKQMLKGTLMLIR
jgi:gliding motility-associated-like protein